ncbi:MAG: PKD domain-containing protein [Bacteroidales bacterium]|nr:PKD domain-containing protein [Bacteroidales bacterium]
MRKCFLFVVCLGLIQVNIYAQPGATCSEAVIIDDIPYVASGLTTVGTIYNSLPCSGSGFANYMSGKDFLFKIIPDQTVSYTIKLSNTSYSVGLFVTNACPDAPNVQCIAYNTSPMGNPSVTATLSEGQTYYIIVSSVSFITPQTNFDIRIDTCSVLPVSSFTYQQNGLEVTFINTSQNAVSYLWYFGDELFPPPFSPGDTSTNPVHTYAQYGTYQVTLISYNSCGQTDTLYQLITLECPYELPQANFTYIANDLTVNFINLSINATSYQWYFGDELIPIIPSDTTENPTHTYQQYGEYNVTLIACNECGCDTITLPVATECPTSLPVAAFTYQQIDQNGTVAFNDQSSNANEWLWFFGDFDYYPYIPGDTVQNPIHTYLISGSYTVHLIACNECGCDTTEQTIYVTVSNIKDIYFSSSIIVSTTANNYLILPENVKIRILEIFDSNGKLVFNAKSPITNKISLYNLNKGVYHIRITTDNKLLYYKLIIN